MSSNGDKIISRLEVNKLIDHLPADSQFEW